MDDADAFRAQHPAIHALHATEQKLRAILDAAVDAIITVNNRGIIESANPAARKLFGYSEAEFCGQTGQGTESTGSRTAGPDALDAR
jgi:PAS domain-containing protein